MVRRKGELNSRGIDKGWPHQIALRSEATYGERYVAARLFCEGLSLCPRSHCFVRDDGYWNVWCFAVRDDAEKFRAQYGGEFLDPKDRPKWPGKSRRSSAASK
jgi:hypothetical protein